MNTSLRRIIGGASVLALAGALVASVPAKAATGFFPKGLFRFGGTDWANMTSAGFNNVTDGNNVSVLNTLGANHLKGLVWVGQFRNATCSWEYADSEVASIVDSVKGNPAILAYQVGDEPDHVGCPQAPSMFAARTALIHQHDPAGKTYTTSDEFNDPSHTPTTSAFRGTVDILGFDVYPCFTWTPTTCDFSMIDRAVPAIQTMHLAQWWPVLQDFQDSSWRWPTPTEITQQFNHWANSGMTGYVVYAWDYLGHLITSQPGNVAALQAANARFGTAPTPTPTPTPTPAPTPTPTPAPTPTPTPAPTPTPTPAATPTPTPHPTATPTPTATAHPTAPPAGPTATARPTAGTPAASVPASKPGATPAPSATHGPVALAPSAGAQPPTAAGEGSSTPPSGGSFPLPTVLAWLTGLLIAFFGMRWILRNV